MNPKFFKIFIFILLLFSGYNLHAQDKIIKKDGTVLEVIIKEITDKQIKYVDYKDPDGILFTIDRALIKEVIFEYGKKMDVSDPKEDPWYFADDKINNIMMNFSAIGGNTLALSYERALKPGQSIMGEMKIYGIGIESYNESSRSGFGLDVYYRLKIKSLFSDNEYRPKHLLHGGYFAPNVGFSTGSYTYHVDYWFDDYHNYSSYTTDHTIMNIGISYGKQWVLQRALTLDASIGFHYFFGDVTNNWDTDNDYYFYNDDELHLGNMWGASNKLLSFNLRIGFLTGKARIVKK